MRRSMLTAAKVLTAKTLGWWSTTSGNQSSTVAGYIFISDVPCPWTGYVESFDSYLASGGTFPDNYFAMCVLSKSGSNFTVKSCTTQNSTSSGVRTWTFSNPPVECPIKAGEYIGWFHKVGSGTSLWRDYSQPAPPGSWYASTPNTYPVVGEVMAGTYVASDGRPIFRANGKGA